MTTCVIGGNGFIGSALIKDLLNSGRNVINVGRSNNSSDNTTYIKVTSLTDTSLYNTLKQGVDEVVLLAYATQPKTSFKDPFKDIEENLEQTIRLFDLLKNIKSIKKVIFISSGGTVYGNQSKIPICETAPTSPISPYGIIKLTIEKFALMYHHLYELPIIILRPSNAYGEGQEAKEGQGFIAHAIKSIIENHSLIIYGKPGTIRDYIHISDLSSAIIAALNNASTGNIYNVGTQLGYSNESIVSILGNISVKEGYQTKIIYENERPFDVKENILDIECIKNDINWSPKIDIEEGLNRTWEWSLKQKKSI